MRTPRQPKQIARLIVVVATVAGPGFLPAQDSAGRLPAVSSIKTAVAAGDLLRALYFKTEYFDGIALGDSLAKKFPTDSRVRAWHIANVAVTGNTRRADSMTTKIDTSSRDPWLLAARSFSRHNPPMSSKAANAEAIRLARRAQKLAPREQDFVWLVASHSLSIPGFPITAGAPIVAYIDSVTQPSNRSIEVQLMRANAQFSSKPFVPGASTPPDTANQNGAIRAYAAARAQDSMSLGAHLDASFRVRQKDEALAMSLGKRAVDIAPRSPNARRNYWALIDAQRGPAVADKRAAIAADRGVFLAMTDSAPWALDIVANGMKYITKEPTDAIDDRILAKAPRSSFAENVLLNRANQWRDSLFAARDSARPGPKSDSNVVKRRFIEASEAFINKPWVTDPSTRDRAISSLFFEVRSDSTYPTPNLIRLVHQVVASQQSLMSPTVRYGEASRALSNRKVELAYAEQLVRDGLKQTARYLNDMPGYFFTSVGEQADALDYSNASMHDQLGWVHFSAGRLTEAEKELNHAVELSKKSVNIYYDLGRIQAAQGRDDDAELTYAQGMSIRTRTVNPNRAELARLYEKKHGSVEGWEKYIAALEEKERATRKAKILATRDTVPKLIPAWSLAELSGRLVKSDSLRSQTVVVNFWGTWCGPCVAEMPELQQFYDKYKNDKSITILTISNDKDLAELRDWMGKRKLTIPTLFDDGYVSKLAQVSVFPTTWFIDNTGKIQFKAIGNTGALVDEWSWRLEATKAGQVIQP